MPGLTAENVEALDRVADETARRLMRDGCTLLLAGAAGARRTVLDVVVGAPVFAGAQKPVARTVIRVASSTTMEYVARLKYGPTECFSQKMPDRTGSFTKAIARAERECESAAEAATAAREALDGALRWSPVPPPPRPAISPQPASKPARRGFFAWLVSIIAALFGRRPAPALPPPRAPMPSIEDGPTGLLASTLVELEKVQAEALARFTKAKEHVARLESERAAYAEERQAAFFDELRRLADDALRGTQVLELVIESPVSPLPVGVVFVDAPDVGASASAELATDYESDGCVYVSDGTRPSAASFSGSEGVPPLPMTSVSKLATADDLLDRIERVRREAPLVTVARATATARLTIARALEQASRTEATSHERMLALEGQRLSDPFDFRLRSMARVASAIRESVTELVERAQATTTNELDALRTARRTAVLAATDRGALERAMRTIDETGQARFREVVDLTNDVVLAEMQRATDSIQLWMLEEIQSRYHVVRRHSMAAAESLPVVSDVIEEGISVKCAPLAGARETFERDRVGYGLGGAAAGAFIGTLIAPVIGTAIGAFVGVFAGFLKGLESLKYECLAKIETSVDAVAAELERTLEEHRPRFESALRSFLEDALDGAMRRFERSITRLVELERSLIASEREKMERLAEARALLAAHETALAELGARAETERAQLSFSIGAASSPRTNNGPSRSGSCPSS